MEQDSKRIVLPKHLQHEMLKFFIKSAVPKKMKQASKPLSEKNDRREQ